VSRPDFVTGLWPRIKAFVEYCEAEGIPAMVSVAIAPPGSDQLVGATALCLLEQMPPEMRTAVAQLVGPYGIEVTTGADVDIATGRIVGDKPS
jgi:hypothetical protein